VEHLREHLDRAHGTAKKLIDLGKRENKVTRQSFKESALRNNI
jgi:hypothetical protein